MPNFKITPRARDDLKKIGRYTQRQWGKSQRNTYLSYPQGQHVIFYLIGQGYIEIVGVVHKEMDIVSYFLPD